MPDDNLNTLGGCGTCSKTDCPLSEAETANCTENQKILKGWKFSGVCALVFILPLALAATGAAVYRGNPTHGLVAGVVGFTLGWLISTVFTRMTTLEQ